MFVNNNNIKKVPPSLTLLKDRLEVDLRRNPIEDPPPDVVGGGASADLSAMWTYFDNKGLIPKSRDDMDPISAFVRACRHRSKKSVLLEIFESIVLSERLEALFEPQNIDGGTPIIPLHELWKPKAPFPGYEAIDRICTAARSYYAKCTEICKKLANRRLHLMV